MFLQGRADELEEEPGWFRLCHCVNCRKASFMANVLFLAKGFRIKEGEGALILSLGEALFHVVVNLFAGRCSLEVCSFGVPSF